METNIDLKTLHFLLAVMDAGSMSAAARRLNTSRSHVSRRIKVLEQELRVQLFRRTTRQMEPTEIGLALYAHASRISQELQALHATVDDLGHNLRGHIRLSLPTALGQQIITPWVLEFAQRHPEVSLQMTFSNRVSDLMAESVDIAIRVASAPLSSSVAQDMGKVDWVLCASPDYLRQHGEPTHPEDLGKLAFLSTPSHRLREELHLTRQNQCHTVLLQPRLQSVDFLFLMRAAKQGLGFAMLPTYSAQDDLAAGHLIALLTDYEPYIEAWGDRLFLITAPNLYPTPASRALLDWLSTRLSGLGSGYTTV